MGTWCTVFIGALRRVFAEMTKIFASSPPKKPLSQPGTMTYLLVLLFGVLLASSDDVPDPQERNWQTVTPALTCDNGNLLRVTSTAPFAHGHARGAFFARYDHHDVVVKKPIGDHTTTKLNTSAFSFRKEVDKIIGFRGHPNVVRLLGWCLDASSGDRLWTVAERLAPFADFLKRPVSWCVLVHCAVTVVSLLDLLNGAWSPARASGDGWLHCDISPGAFAISKHAEAKMVDFGGLSYRPAFPVEAVPCTGHGGDDECARGYCLRPWFTRHHVKMDEFHCNKRARRCNGFDPRAMLRVLCEAMLEHLIAPQLLETRGALNASAAQRILDGCMANNRDRRWSPTLVGNALREYLYHNGGFDCLRLSNVELDRAFYRKSDRITAATIASAKGPHRRRLLVNTPSLEDLMFDDPYSSA